MKIPRNISLFQWVVAGELHCEFRKSQVELVLLPEPFPRYTGYQNLVLDA